MNAPRDRLRALAMAVLCHGLFAGAVGSMVFALSTGLQWGRGTCSGPVAALANGLLLAQFSVLHSLLLSRRGRPWLQRLSPVGHGRTLAPSTFVVVASLQLLATFWLWSPSRVVWHAPSGGLGGLQWALFALSWLFLQKALYDAGLALQTGTAGWWALWRGQPVRYGELPTAGLFACCRQPIYLGFAAVLWTAPTWTPDWLALAAVWSSYCVLGPLAKEARWLRLFGERFAAYRTAVPYFLPRFRR